MEFPFASMDEVVGAIRRVTAGAREPRQVPGHPRRRALDHARPVVAAMAARYIRGSRCSRSTRTRTCASRSWARRTTTRAPCGASLEYAPTTQVGIRSLSPEEAAAAPTLPTQIFYDFNMRNDPNWIDRVVDSLSETVYITIDVDGFDPAIMPATGTPEPGGLPAASTKGVGAAAAGDRTPHRSSAATSSSCGRCRATSRRTS